MGNVFGSIVALANVEKLWESLWQSLWENCGKVLHMVVDFVVLDVGCGKVDVLHWVVEKVYTFFTHNNNSGRSGVLHSFHIPYYYYYYFLYRKG